MHQGMGFTLILPPRGSDLVKTPGIDFGGKMRLVFRDGAYAVVRTPAGTHWAGIGTRNPHPSEWALVKLERVHVSAKHSLSGRAFTRTRAIVILTEEPGRKWRDCKERFVKEAKARAKMKPSEAV